MQNSEFIGEETLIAGLLNMLRYSIIPYFPHSNNPRFDIPSFQCRELLRCMMSRTYSTFFVGKGGMVGRSCHVVDFSNLGLVFVFVVLFSILRDEDDGKWERNEHDYVASF